MKQIYNQRIKRCGSHITLYEYSEPKMKGYEILSRVDFSKSEDGIKREDNLYRTRSNLIDLINCNMTPYSKFITLTFKDTILDKKEALKEFNIFSKLFKYYFGYKLRYVMVSERQKERGKKEGNLGCWHFHLVVFIQEKLDTTKLYKCWTKGNIDIRIVDNAYNTARYIAKYIQKDSFECALNDKLIYCSQGLNRPIESRLQDSELIEKIKAEYEKKKTYNAQYKVCSPNGNLIDCRMTEYELQIDCKTKTDK